jgi:hypothetical protein
MAVRALIGAHLRSSINATTRDAGKWLAGLAAVVMTLAVSTMMLFVALLLGTLGFAAAPETVTRHTSAAVWFFTLMPFVIAVLSLMGGDARTLDWEKLKPYPVPRGPLFVAEVLASTTNPFALGGLASLASFAVGLGVHEPTLAPRLPLVFVTAALFTVSLRSLVATAALWLVNHLQVLLLLFLMGLPFFALSVIDLEHPEALDGGWAETLRQVGWQVLPAGWQLSGTHAVESWAVLVVPVALFALAYRLAFREALPTRVRAVKPERLWSFRSPVVGLARVAVRSIWATDLGRFTALAPVAWVLPALLARQKLSQLSGLPAIDPAWLWLGAWLMGPTMLTNLLHNQFGADRGAVKALMLLPVGERELLRGKALGLFAIAAANGLLLAPLAWYFVRPGWAFALAGPLTGFTLFVINVAAGQFTSVLWPRPMPRKSLRPPSGNLLVGLVSSAILLCTTVPIGLLWWSLHDEPLTLLAVLGAVAVVALALWWATSLAAEQFLALRRERLVETLS